MKHARNPEKRQKIVVSAIGTGGHYFPAIVVAKELVRQGAEVLVLTRKGYHEHDVAKKHDLMTFTIRTRPFYGRSLFDKASAIFFFVYSSFILFSIVKNARGIAFGGFSTLPLVIACLFRRRDFFLFEPNRKAGRATKLFSAKAKNVFLGMPLVDRIRGNLLITGIPIRSGFKNTENADMRKRGKTRVILFLGGSGGSYAVNKLALEMQGILPDNYRIVIISGTRDYQWVLKNASRTTRVIPFTFTPWLEMRAADVIVARSGALAGYEILATDTPVIFIPFPYAIDDHQYHNAEYFARIGNALVVREDQATGQVVAKKIHDMMKQRKKRPDIIRHAERIIAERIMKGST
jgi:UDP-N-acetylglucosamine--N-acetylmuramyl-(pentapeptide) pyrophosphoryl-undecaprenol N-acetylglucosamine transferase